MAAPGFGFSAGDIIAGIELIHKAGKALKQSSGANREYQQTVLDLEAIEATLRILQALTAPDSTEFIQTIAYLGHLCHAPIARFRHEVGKFEKHWDWSLGPGKPSPKSVLAGIHKIQWAVVVENEAAQLKSSIVPLLNVINVYFHLENHEMDRVAQFNMRQELETAKTMLVSIDGMREHDQQDRARQDQSGQLMPQIADISTQILEASQQIKSLACLIDGISGQNTSETRIASLEYGVSKLMARQDQTNNLLLDFSRKNDLQLADLNKAIPRLHDRTEAPELAVSRDFHHLSLATETPLSTLAGPEPKAHTLTQATRKQWSLQASTLCTLLQQNLWVIVVFLLRVAPAFQRGLRVLAEIARSPSLLLDDNIILTDVLGRSMSLPYEHFRFWNVLIARLEHSFLGLPGQLHIARQEFAFFKDASNSASVITSARDWERSVFADTRVAMSVFAKGHAVSSVCPACGSSQTQLCSARHWNMWFVDPTEE